MKSKGIIITIAIVTLLTIIYIIQQRSTVQKSATAGYVKLLPNGFSTNTVWRIELYKGEERDSGVKLKREDTGWKVVTLSWRKADNRRVEKLFSDLQLMRGDLRGYDPELFSDFLISDKEAIHIVFYDKTEKEYLHLLAGKREPIFGHRFIRFKNDAAVYLIDKKLQSSIGAFGDNNGKRPDHMSWLAP